MDLRDCYILMHFKSQREGKPDKGKGKTDEGKKGEGMNGYGKTGKETFKGKDKGREKEKKGPALPDTSKGKGKGSKRSGTVCRYILTESGRWKGGTCPFAGL
eukprot:4960065-Amphidinium_carterae.2